MRPVRRDRVRRELVDHPTVGFVSWRGTPNLMTRLHRHEEVECNFIERGAITYLHRDKLVTLHPARLTLFWAAIPHRLISFPKSTVAHWLNIPLRWLLQHQLPTNLVQAILQGEIIEESDLTQFDFDLRLFHRWHQDLKSPSPERQLICHLELQARLRRLAFSAKSLASSRPLASESRRGAPSASSPEAIGKVELMARFIAENYTEPLRVANIAKLVGLHPNYAMSLFRKAFGMHLSDYLTQQRLAHAQRLILTTDRKILDIALEAGFGSASRFYAAFHRAYGQAPGDYRASQTEAWPHPALTPSR